MGNATTPPPSEPEDLPGPDDWFDLGDCDIDRLRQWIRDKLDALCEPNVRTLALIMDALRTREMTAALTEWAEDRKAWGLEPLPGAVMAYITGRWNSSWPSNLAQNILNRRRRPPTEGTEASG